MAHITTTQARVLSSVALRVKWGARGAGGSVWHGPWDGVSISTWVSQNVTGPRDHRQLFRSSLLPGFLAFPVFHFLAATFSEICTGNKMVASYRGTISSPGCHLGLWPSRHLARWAGPLQDPAWPTRGQLTKWPNHGSNPTPTLMGFAAPTSTSAKL